jgi:hypothetical protein
MAPFTREIFWERNIGIWIDALWRYSAGSLKVTEQEGALEELKTGIKIN